MKRKQFLMGAILLASTSFSLEGELKTGGSLEFNFKSREDNESTEKNEEDFEYKQTSYKLNLFDLKYSDKDYGIVFGANLKSSRKNILIDDWSNENYLKLEKEANHDIQGKLFAKYDSVNDFSGIKPRASFEYYLDNYLKSQVRRDNEIITENTFDYEYISDELDENGKNKKYNGGDTKFNLGFNLEKENIKDSLDVEYYANRVVDYTKGYPHLKLTNKYEQKIDANTNMDLKYDFNLNLRSFAKAYIEEKENEQDENFAFLNNYVRRFRQIATFNLTNKEENREYSVNTDFKHNAYYIAGPNASDKNSIINHRFFFDVKSNLKNKIYSNDIHNVSISNNFNLESKFETAKYLNNNKFELWAMIKPSHTLAIEDELKWGEYNIKPELKIKPELVIPLTKDMFDINYLVHRYDFAANTKLSNEKENEKSNLELNNNVKLSYVKTDLEKVELNLNQKYDFEKKLLENLDSKINFENKFTLSTIKDVQGRLYFDKIKDEYKLGANLKYRFNENLDLETKASLRHEFEWDYTLDGGKVPYIPNNNVASVVDQENDRKKPEINFPKPAALEDVLKEPEKFEEKDYSYLLKPEIDLTRIVNPNRDFENKANLVLFVQEYALDTKINYNKQMDKFTLNSSLGIETKLDLIALTKEKISKERNQDEDLEENRKKLDHSYSDELVFNVGGKIRLNPNASLKYDFTENLSLTSNIGVDIDFAKLVLNKITDEKRTDLGTYGPKDMKFKLRKIVPKVGFELNYKW